MFRFTIRDLLRALGLGASMIVGGLLALFVLGPGVTHGPEERLRAFIAVMSMGIIAGAILWKSVMWWRDHPA